MPSKVTDLVANYEFNNEYIWKVIIDLISLSLGFLIGEMEMIMLLMAWNYYEEYIRDV